MVDLTKLDIDLNNISEMLLLFGAKDKYLKLLNRLYGIKIYANQNQLLLDTSDDDIVGHVKRLIEILMELIKKGISFNERDIIYIHHILDREPREKILRLFLDRREIIKTKEGRPIYPKTINQATYVGAMDTHTLTFAIGPAGTGKTYLAVLNALAKLKAGDIKRIILTRPAVEAGENLGFLPGDLKEKIDPYLRPLYDAMYEILGVKETEEMIEKGVVEIAPLAYMRGRTLESAYVILDEAQNTTVGQIKLFLTRLGFGSKMIVTGDVTQSDLPKHMKSGLVGAAELLRGIDDIAIMRFSRIDVVRHPLVQTIIERFDRDAG